MARCRFKHGLSASGFREATAAAAGRRPRASPPRQITHVTSACTLCSRQHGGHPRPNMASFCESWRRRRGEQAVSFGEQTGESNSRLQGHHPFWNRLTEYIHPAQGPRGKRTEKIDISRHHPNGWVLNPACNQCRICSCTKYISRHPSIWIKTAALGSLGTGCRDKARQHIPALSQHLRRDLHRDTGWWLASSAR